MNDETLIDESDNPPAKYFTPLLMLLVKKCGDQLING